MRSSLDRNTTVALFLVALTASLLLIPTTSYNNHKASAQRIFNFLITLVQNKPETGEVAVVVSFADEISTVKRDVDEKKVEVPIRLGTFSESTKQDDAKVCVTILSNGEQVCKTISNVSEDKLNKLTINLRQVECNTQFCQSK